jgi:hypothetical protein
MIVAGTASIAVATMWLEAFGIRCLKTMRPLEEPAIRAAAT